MRITCPNCNAHYEIGEELIRPEGRDVQCSNCGTTWFQEGRGPAATVAPATVRARDRPAAEAARDEDGDSDGEVDGGATATPRPARRPSADKAALDILREERAREDRLRAGMRGDPSEGEMPSRGAAGSPETDLLPATNPREAAAAERVRMGAAASRARARDGGLPDPRDAGPPPVGDPGAEAGAGPVTGAEAEAPDDVSDAVAATLRDAAAAPSPATGASVVAAPVRRERITRRALLPDIEEINSSLRPDDGPGGADAKQGAKSSGADAPPSRSGFRSGFLAVCALTLVLVGCYAFADGIIRAVPALAEPVARYVAWVDARRMGLEDAVEALTKRIAPEP